MSSAPFFLEVESLVNYLTTIVLENEGVVIAVFQSARQNVCIRNLHTITIEKCIYFFFNLSSEQFQGFVRSFSFRVKESV